MKTLGIALVSVVFASGCEALKPSPSPRPPAFYSLDYARSGGVAAPRTLPAAAPTLVVSAPRAAAGYDSQRIIYVRQPHKLEYFAHSEWIDTPARMLAPLIVGAIESSGAFRAVVAAPSSASGDLRLDTEVLQLQHEFAGRPSSVRFALRVDLVEGATRWVVASREFEAVAPSSSEDPYGGVVAANQAVQTVLGRLAAFCAEAAATWRPRSGGEDTRPGSKPR